MIETFQLKGGISEVNFGYTAKTEVYTNLSSDITKLAEFAFNCKRGGSKSSCRIDM